jgi:FMN phosphatase YigB (HAD superfamily)
MAGARAAGMQAIWRRDPKHSGTIVADAVIEELRDLPALLRLTDIRPLLEK